MFDGEALYPGGRHPRQQLLNTPGIRDKAPLRLSDIPTKYYLIDFGHSDMFDSFEERAPILGRRGQYRQAPELQAGIPIDGFKLDIWCAGYTFQWLITNVRDPYAASRRIHFRLCLGIFSHGRNSGETAGSHAARRT